MKSAETGYEARFDYPAWEGPPLRPYLLATAPRSGSTYLSHVLWRTGCLGAPLEYLNFDPNGPYGFASASPAEQRKLWHAALRTRTSPNGVFGLKGFPIQFEDVHASNPGLLREVMRTILPPGTVKRVVRLRRRDRVAHAVSYARAMLSGVWRKEQEHAAMVQPGYSQVAVERAANLVEAQEKAWSQMFAEMRIEPLELWYEDVVATPEDAVRQVAEYLGVKLETGRQVAVPEVVRQSQHGAKAWIEAHLRGGNA